MDTIGVLDFGGQYTHLIANRIRRLGVFSEIVPCNTPANGLSRFNGLILSGGPSSVLDDGSPTVDPRLFSLGIPVLGLCYGHQLMAKLLGGSVARGHVREYGSARITIERPGALFAGLEASQQVWMSHGDTVEKIPGGFVIQAFSGDCATAAVGDEKRKLFGLQFHPEVADTPRGMVMLGNFLDLCACGREWNPETFSRDLARDMVRRCEGRSVFLLVSGGVDSTAAFALLNQALGPHRVVGLHIDTGLMRHNESADIRAYMKEHGFDNLHIVDASEEFLSALAGIVEPEEKRRIIGNTFLTVQRQAQKNLGLNAEDWLLGQGTIYPDTIESAGTEHAEKIKTHHNRVDIVLELIEKGLVVEPLSQLYKDEVRTLGESLGLPRKLIWRHPFPGPGLGVRVLCSDGAQQAVDSKLTGEVAKLAEASGYRALVLPIRSVGVQGDGRTYAHPVLLCGPREWPTLISLSTRITNAVTGVNRVVFALSTETESPVYRLEKSFLTRDRLERLRRIDHLVTETLYATGEYESVWQLPVVLLPLVNDSGRECVVLRPIMSQEAMTARFVPLSGDAFARIISAARGIEGLGDIFVDLSNKPPGTIEWE